jgi:Glycosyl transferase family 2
VTSPRLSVILPVRRAEATIERTVASLLEQCTDQSVEIIAAVCGNDPSAVLLDAAARAPLRVLTVDAPAGVPQLRRDAALQAKGEFIAIVEDHCGLPAHWLTGILQAAEGHPGAVCGGPVDNGRRSIIGWAQYFTRYSAFLPPTAAGPVRSLPGNNACYPARLIAARIASIHDGFWEAEFNRELARDGVAFQLIPNLAVTQYQVRGAFEYVPLRFHHGRCYGARRIGPASKAERRNLLLRCPTIPLLLFYRIARSVLRARWNRAIFFVVSPLIFVYVCSWSIGEIAGYLAGPGDSCTDTD